MKDTLTYTERLRHTALSAQASIYSQLLIFDDTPVSCTGFHSLQLAPVYVSYIGGVTLKLQCLILCRCSIKPAWILCMTKSMIHGIITVRPSVSCSYAAHVSTVEPYLIS